MHKKPVYQTRKATCVNYQTLPPPLGVQDFHSQKGTIWWYLNVVEVVFQNFPLYFHLVALLSLPARFFLVVFPGLSFPLPWPPLTGGRTSRPCSSHWPRRGARNSWRLNRGPWCCPRSGSGSPRPVWGRCATSRRRSQSRLKWKQCIDVFWKFNIAE